MDDSRLFDNNIGILTGPSLKAGYGHAGPRVYLELSLESNI